MSEPGHPRRTTALVGALLAVLLAVAYAITSGSVPDPGPVVPPTATPAPFPTVTTTTPPPGTPRPGADFPVRKVGALDADRSVLLNGRGHAELRYRRAAQNGTRLHFICTGCDGDTWLVELPRGNPVGGGPLLNPADVIWAVDTVALGPSSSLLVQAPPTALWTVTLTPFDAVPVNEQTFGSLGDDVVAVATRSDLQLTCGGASFVRTLARGAGEDEYAVDTLQQQDDPGTFPVRRPPAADRMIMMVSCPGRWTVTFP